MVLFSFFLFINGFGFLVTIAGVTGWEKVSVFVSLENILPSKKIASCQYIKSLKVTGNAVKGSYCVVYPFILASLVNGSQLLGKEGTFFFKRRPHFEGLRSPGKQTGSNR